MHECICNPIQKIGSLGTREQAEKQLREMSDDHIARVLEAHREPHWQKQAVHNFHGNGKAPHPNLRRFMRLIQQEAHRRGIDPDK